MTAAEQACLPGARPRLLRLGTRASALATTQSEWVAGRLRELGHQVELVTVRTEGDASDRPLTEIGGAGVFAGALRRALHEGRIDVAVHSLKDLPVAGEPGLVLAAVPEREDPRDALVARAGLPLADLPDGTVLGTGSPRRAAQLALVAPHVKICDIRGNVDTRIGKVRSGELDAVVLAAAGLHRLGRIEEASEVLDPTFMLPAPGQGALAVECRADDEAVIATVQPLDDATTRRCVRAERALLARLEAGCTAPVAALGTVDGDALELTGFVALDGRSARGRMRGTEPVHLGHRLADALLADLRQGSRTTTGPAAPHDIPPAHINPTERDT
ncbi:MAG: hydroxymethylbilane synthase [Actinomycetota bacterium]|nr:hydroxymethylbilane synthase [Actinomycetota bacterium]MDQ3528152.1 hydroxymethylbilane synthase [Actinomycetota bacterium]